MTLIVSMLPFCAAVYQRQKAQSLKDQAFHYGGYFVYFGGERGIRTLDTRKRIHTFQACSFSHSDTSPRRAIIANILYSAKYETIDLEKNLELSDNIAKNTVPNRRYYMQSSAKSRASSDDFSRLRGSVWGYRDQSLVCLCSDVHQCACEYL